MDAIAQIRSQILDVTKLGKTLNKSEYERCSALIDEARNELGRGLDFDIFMLSAPMICMPIKPGGE